MRQVEPSPTTGSLFKPQTVYRSFGSTNYTSMADSSNIENLEENSSCFEFKPLSRSMFSEDIDHKQSQKLLQVSSQCLPQSLTSSAIVATEATGSSNAQNLSFPVNMTASLAMAATGKNLDDSKQTSSSTGIQDSQSDHKGTRLCDDGYDWRKYGQKLVKGSEFSRSYYKCTHRNCEAKKLFQRARDGRITEIVYKGTHGHPKPQPCRRYSAGAIMSIHEDRTDKASTLSCQDGIRGEIFLVSVLFIMDNSCLICLQIRPAMFTAIYILLLSPMLLSTVQYPCAAGVNTLRSVALQSNRIYDEVDDDDDDPLSKRRKMDSSEIDVTPIVNPIEEARVVVQTLSEVDVLDDGYRWRKYGQKVVRGNPNPRSYYKCTNVECPVRKHVERASHDPKTVLTTYEGKHNHNVPTARTSSHDTAAPLSLTGCSRIRSENIDTISLNLGVGVNTAAESRSSELPQASHPEAIQRQIHLGTSNFKVVEAIPVSIYYGSPDSSMKYVSKGNQDEGHNGGLSPQNMGDLCMGP